MINAVIVDDEPSAGEVIKTLVTSFSGAINICATCLNVADAVAAVNKYAPAIIFLDIELADGSGFEVLESPLAQHARVIFITAYENYALKAIKHHAFDYILKPVIPHEFHGVLSKVLSDIRQSESMANASVLLNYLKGHVTKKIAIPDRQGLQYYLISDIIMIQGEGSYSKMFLRDNKTLVVSKLVKDFEVSLHDTFLRVHKSYLVNPDHITAFKKEDNGYLVMSNGVNVPISLKDKDHILDSLKMHSTFI